MSPVTTVTMTMTMTMMGIIVMKFVEVDNILSLVWKENKVHRRMYIYQGQTSQTSSKIRFQTQIRLDLEPASMNYASCERVGFSMVVKFLVS